MVARVIVATTRASDRILGNPVDGTEHTTVVLILWGLPRLA